MSNWTEPRIYTDPKTNRPNNIVIYAGKSARPVCERRIRADDNVAQIKRDFALIAEAGKLARLLICACKSVSMQAVWDKPPYSEWYYEAEKTLAKLAVEALREAHGEIV